MTENILKRRLNNENVEFDPKNMSLDNRTTFSDKFHLAHIDLADLEKSNTEIGTPDSAKRKSSFLKTPFRCKSQLPSSVPNFIFSTPQSTFSDADLDCDAVFMNPSHSAAPSQSSQRHSFNASSSFYGLPDTVQYLLKCQRGISQLYDWQHQCLTSSCVRQHKNLIYSLPTSGGKTLVADILILQTLLLEKKDALLVLPFVAIVQEKVAGLSPFGLELGFVVEEYAGNRGNIPPVARRKSRVVYIATIERAYTLVKSLVETKLLHELGLVVVDELHMIGDEGERGATLESLLTLLMLSSTSTRLVGMSATLSNIDDLKRFMKAELFVNNFRPVELKEYCKIGHDIYLIDSARNSEDPEHVALKRERSLSLKHYTAEERLSDPDGLLELIMEVVPLHSCLIFCPIKRQCENLAVMLCQQARFVAHVSRDARSNTRRAHLIERLQLEGEHHVCPILRQTLPFGVAYHHGGLTQEERHIIEEAYTKGVVCVLCCTSTLAAGVNLPAKRVILRAPRIAQQFITHSKYKQMVGRAGRAGIDTSGEAITVLVQQDRTMFLNMLSSTAGLLCRSALLQDGRAGLRNLVLAVVVLGLAQTQNTLLQDLITCTLLHVQDAQLANVATRAVLSELVHEQLLRIDGVALTPTKLGQAAVRSGVKLACCPKICAGLRDAQQALNLTSFLHLLFLVTPFDAADNVTVNWPSFMTALNRLRPHEISVLQLVGCSEADLTRRACGQPLRGSRLQERESALRRFYVTLVLYAIWSSQPLWQVAEDFGQPRGAVQSWITAACSLASALARFVEPFDEFWCYRVILPELTQRLGNCVNAELQPLLELPGVKRPRARQLFRAGYCGLAEVARARVEQLVNDVTHLPKRAARRMIDAARMLQRERLEQLQMEAEHLVLGKLSMESVNRSNDDIFI